MILFFDSEFTGLRKDTTLVSIGIKKFLTDDYFYAELTDYDKSQVEGDEFLEKEVIGNLYLEPTDSDGRIDVKDKFGCQIEAIGVKEYVFQALKLWLENVSLGETEQIIFWSDCLNYDWTLFLHDINGKELIDKNNVSYIPRDICTFMDICGVDPDISREEFIKDTPVEGIKHNSLYDAKVIEKCFSKLIELHNNKQEY